MTGTGSADVAQAGAWKILARVVVAVTREERRAIGLVNQMREENTHGHGHREPPGRHPAGRPRRTGRPGLGGRLLEAEGHGLLAAVGEAGERLGAVLLPADVRRKRAGVGGAILGEA